MKWWFSETRVVNGEERWKGATTVTKDYLLKCT
jgi:hypothetical protein